MATKLNSDVEALIIALRDSRRRHLEARIARDSYVFETTRALKQKQKDTTWSAASMEAANTERALMPERAASNAYHDCEELLWRLRFALGPYSEHPGGMDTEPRTTE
jgi:hypothetical protein